MAIRVSGSQSYSSTSDVPTPGGAAAFTLMCWAQIVVDQNYYSMIMAADQSGAGTYLEIGTDVDGTTLHAFNSGGGSITGGALTVGTWYRIALAVSGANGTLYWGAPGSALSTATGATMTAVTSPIFYIGTDGAGEVFNGRIANVKQYDATLSQAAIEVELWQYQPARTANLARWHPFLTPDTVDYSGNGRTLTASGAPTTEDGPPILWTQPRRPQPYTSRRRAANW